MFPDIDECKENSNICGDQATHFTECINHNGAYSCRCTHGYKENVTNDVLLGCTGMIPCLCYIHHKCKKAPIEFLGESLLEADRMVA